MTARFSEWKKFFLRSWGFFSYLTLPQLCYERQSRNVKLWSAVTTQFDVPRSSLQKFCSDLLKLPARSCSFVNPTSTMKEKVGWKQQRGSVRQWLEEVVKELWRLLLPFHFLSVTIDTSERTLISSFSVSLAIKISLLRQRAHHISLEIKFPSSLGKFSSADITFIVLYDALVLAMMA